MATARKSGGFGLIEMAVAIILFGMVVTAFSYGLKASIAARRQDQTQARLTAIESALSIYINRYGMAPCPASFNDAPDTARYAQPVTSCQGAVPGLAMAGGRQGMRIAIGALPVRALNLPDEYMDDGYGAPFSYAVTALMTLSRTSYNNNEGAITIREQAQPAPPATLTDKAIYAITSHGQDGLGARLQGCANTHLDGENCDNDGTFLTASYSTQGRAMQYDDYLRHADKLTLITSPVRRYMLDYMDCYPDMRSSPPEPKNASGFRCATVSATGHDIAGWPPMTGRLLYTRQVTAGSNGQVFIRATIPVRYSNMRVLPNPELPGYEQAIQAGIYVDGRLLTVGDIINPEHTVRNTSGGSGTAMAMAPIVEGQDYNISIFLFSFGNSWVVSGPNNPDTGQPPFLGSISLWAGTIRLADYDVRGVVEIMETGVD